MGGWRGLLTSVFEELGPAAERRAAAVPARDRDLGRRTCSTGIEVELLAGVTPEEAPHREVLDAFGDMIERAEKPG